MRRLGAQPQKLRFKTDFKMFRNYKLMSIFLSLHRDDVFNALEQEFQLSTPTEHPTEKPTKNNETCVNCGSTQLVKNNGSIYAHNAVYLMILFLMIHWNITKTEHTTNAGLP